MLVSLVLYQNYESGGLIYTIANNQTDQVQAYLASYQTFEMPCDIGACFSGVIIGIIPG